MKPRWTLIALGVGAALIAAGCTSTAPAPLATVPKVLVELAASQGYDATRIQKVPQKWN